ncbi:MAG: hypothetical protein KKD44_20450 [Proteobacteria bacterium]|nr:hypothetical protein [Pseudomonadota bacterium]
MRSKGLRLFFMADLTDGLSRGEEPPQLRALGRSITETAIQQLYRDYVTAFVQLLEPDYIGLASETNLIRKIAPANVYTAVVQAANDAAGDLEAIHATAPILISVQVETAWGVLGGDGTFEGIDTDIVDFPFAQALGLSSYPYFGFAQPDDIPDDYYSRLLAGISLPAMVVEGGWISNSVGAITSSQDTQARYIALQADLLDSISAKAVIQTLFADIDISSLPLPIPDNLSLFTTLGLMNENFGAKQALDVWDNSFARQKQ